MPNGEYTKRQSQKSLLYDRDGESAYKAAVFRAIRGARNAAVARLVIKPTGLCFSEEALLVA